MTIQEGIEAIRRIVSEMEGDEYDVLDALTDEAEGWSMRFKVLAQQSDDE